MNKVDYLVIAYLERNNSSTIKDLSNNLHIDKAIIYKSVNRLKKIKKLKEINQYPKEVFLI